MRLSRGTILVGLACLVGFSEAFATPANLAKLARRDGLDLDGVLTGIAALKQRNVDLSLDITTSGPTKVVVDGAHEFKPPNFAKGDQRGPCPGLNALANHGYMSRDGVVGVLEAIEATNSVFGMGLDLSTFIATMGLTATGNPLSLNPGFSIGGKSSKSQNLLGNLLGLLGEPRGLEGSHNFIEADSSNTRDDLYVTGDASTMNMSLFKEVYDIIGNRALNMEAIGDRAAQRLAESIATNPLFYYGPFTGLIVRNAAYLFTGRLLSNHSTEYPRGGHLDRTSFKSLWGVTESPSGELTYNRGQERIPSNWYRLQGDYTLVDLNLDLVAWISKHPEIANIGGNMGKVNSFTPVNLADISGGVLNGSSLLEGNNLMCFALEIVKTFAPNSLSTLFATLAQPLKLINGAVAAPLISLACPAFEELQNGGKDFADGLLQTYPGAKKSGSMM